MFCFNFLKNNNNIKERILKKDLKLHASISLFHSSHSIFRSRPTTWHPFWRPTDRFCLPSRSNPELSYQTELQSQVKYIDRRVETVSLCGYDISNRSDSYRLLRNELPQVKKFLLIGCVLETLPFVFVLFLDFVLCLHGYPLVKRPETCL